MASGSIERSGVGGSTVGDGARAVTLGDVARTAGVSIATASKALNGRGQLRAETRARVIDAAEQLEFRGASLARDPFAGRAGTVGVLASDLGRKSSLRVLMGAEEALGAQQTGVLLCDARGDVIRERHHAKEFLRRRVDGIVVVGARTDFRPSLGQHLPVPVVYAYAPSDDSSDLSVASDDVGGGNLAIQHLISQGRRRIAHISGDHSYKAARDRADGALQSLGTVGLELAGDRVLFGTWDESWGRGATRLLLTQTREVDAVFAGSDQVARGVLDAVKEHGLSVPEDIAIIGFDNLDLLVANARPQLTSVDMRLEEIGARAVDRLFAAIDGGGPTPGIETIPSRVVQRGSTAPLN